MNAIARRPRAPQPELARWSMPCAGPRRPLAQSARGFTLVEMLVVIVIIGILAALITGAAYMARLAAKRAVVKIEIEQLSIALEHYKGDVGEYPPDFVFLQPVSTVDADDRAGLTTRAQNDILRHIRKRFPRYVPVGDTSSTSQTPWQRFCYDVRESYSQVAGKKLDPDNFDPASALVFLLGGLPATNTTNPEDWTPAGFSTDPTFPFKPGEPRTKPYFDFARERLRVVDGTRYLRYYPSYIEVPYVYFKCRSNEYGATNSTTPPTKVYPSAYVHDLTNNNICTSYLEPPSGARSSWQPNLPTPTASTKKRLWRAPGKFQIITAGLDGEFGKDHCFRYTKDGVQLKLDGTEFASPALDAGNLDNLTNFAEGTLEDEMQ